MAGALESPPYAGFIAYGDELHAGEPPPLISEATFQKAEHMRQYGAPAIALLLGRSPPVFAGGLRVLSGRPL